MSALLLTPLKIGKFSIKELMSLSDDLPPQCPLCERPIPPDVPQSVHHLIPKLRGGRAGPKVLLHHLCHKEIHASLSESELAVDFNTIERLKVHPRLERFIAWVAKRPPEFNSRAPSHRKKQKRRR